MKCKSLWQTCFDAFKSNAVQLICILIIRLFVACVFFSLIRFDSSLFAGSPEMAFVHAMAAAAAASFVARACRDGQLSTCGCSRSSRPRQLHSDWTWGGCGDDLQFGYK